MSIAKRLASQTAVYGVSSIVGRILTYFLVPVYTARFAAAQYGIVTGLYAYVSFLNVIFTYGMETTYFRFANRPGTDRRLLYDQVLSLLLVSSVLLTALLLWQAPLLLDLLGLPASSAQYAFWIALILGMDALAAIPFARLRLENKAKKFASIRMANILLTVVLNLFFIVFCPDVLAGKYLTGLQPLVERVYDPSMGVGYVFLSNLVASFLTLVLLGRELTDFRFRLSLEPLRPLLKYAYPIMLMGLAGMVNETLDRILLPKWLPENFYPGQSSLTAVGVYGACYKLSIFMQLVTQAFKYAAEPFFFAQSTEKNSPRVFAMVLKWFTLSCAVIFVVVSVNVEDFGRLFLHRAEYLEGLVVVPILLLANLFLGVYWNLSVWFKLTDKTYYGTYIGFGGAILTIALNFLLIPVLGYMGSALATLACYFMMAAVCWWLGNHHFPVPYPIARLLTWIGLASVVVAVAWFVPLSEYWTRHAFHALLTLGFIALLVLVERPHRLQTA
ncbi:Membrane protein involved in the export of O-antigen and teichoic acid [Hymenobacter gelipurpurascens]|uniref:Membrane protein involved in the export of O-antigen and teichoic acid n=1 Tax=Hymenobacter gelipurpurascens TaxID=89968 RepID=A0A212UCQ5_9BACT|nr:polysaccharide biosynthesis C-terminal domain-containing protein [Hymenobacter gelipurpurascens]SNC75871.1 Membrane protein involved in the export of O-antigen and teichoic acid [Hymenobacter gelipurpurascens]